MSIRQPVKKTILSNEFQNHSFSFPVESILQPQQGSGKLVISASAGYLLTTSHNNEPTSEQTLEHILQPNGDRVARDMITLVANDESHETSTVTIRNPSGETVVLTVDPTAETALIHQQPNLVINTQALTFAKTTPGKPTFQVFKIAQQNANTPIVISTDSPENFEVASDNRPAFSPSLTLTPSSTGTYIHVRYTPGKARRNKAQLIIETPYDSQQISLLGQRAGLRRGVYSVKAASPIKRKTTTRTWPVLVLTTFLITILAVTGYHYRYLLLSYLAGATPKPITKPRLTPSIKPALQIEVGPVQYKTKPSGDQKRAKIKRKPTPTESLGNPVVTEKRPDQSIKSDPLRDKPGSPAQNTDLPPKPSPEPARRKAVSKQNVTTTPPVLTNPVPGTTAESDLEKELNKNPKPSQ